MEEIIQLMEESIKSRGHDYEAETDATSPCSVGAISNDEDSDEGSDEGVSTPESSIDPAWFPIRKEQLAKMDRVREKLKKLPFRHYTADN